MRNARPCARPEVIALAILTILGVPAGVTGQADVPVYQTDFPPEEFKARWAKVFDQIGPTAVTIVEGVGLTPGFIFPRQASAARAQVADYWDQRPSEELNFVHLLQTRLGAEVRDLSPILDGLRSIKSPREIDLIRRSQIAAPGIIEAMKATEPGVYEYQLDAAARYVFLVNGARLDAYRSITAAGMTNIVSLHYFRNTSQAKAGDLVLMDYAPDFRYYTSDIGRMWGECDAL